MIIILRGEGMRHVWETGELHFVVRHEGKRPLITHRRRWEDIIKMNFPEVGWGIDSIDLA